MSGEPIGGVDLHSHPPKAGQALSPPTIKASSNPGTDNGVQTGAHRITIEKAESDDLMRGRSQDQQETSSALSRFGHGGTEHFDVEINETTEDLVIDVPAK